MIALKDILVVTDFSDCSQAAVDEGRTLAELFGARLHLLHVVTEPLHETWAGYAPASDFLDIVQRFKADSNQRLEQMARADGSRIRVVVATVWGDPSVEILKYAANHGIDVIVCGTHGRHGWDHLVMGSVAERLVRLAPCPVLTVRAARPARATAA